MHQTAYMYNGNQQVKQSVKYEGCFQTLYIKIHHIYITILQINACILTVWL